MLSDIEKEFTASFGRWLGSKGLSAHEAMEAMEIIADAMEDGKSGDGMLRLPIQAPTRNDDEEFEDRGDVLMVEAMPGTTYVVFGKASELTSACNLPTGAPHVKIVRTEEAWSIFAFPVDDECHGTLEFKDGGNCRYVRDGDKC